MGWTYVPMLFNPLLLNAVFFTWPALFNQNADDLSAGGFFYTDEVLYFKKPVYYNNKYFLEEPNNIKLLLLRKKDNTICFHCGVALKDWKITDSVWREHARWSPKCIYKLHIKGPAFVLDCVSQTE